MDTSLLIILGLSVAAFLVLVWRSGATQAISGSRDGLVLFAVMLPRLLLAFVLAGLVQALVPHETVARWLSDTAGMRALVIATVAGALTPGGPFLQFPIVAAVYKMGAGTGAIVAYLTAWSLMGLHRVVLWELPFLGPRLTFTRFLVSVPLPLIAGWITRWLLRATV
jgi:uncharacterized membrane protein YraQ (UPF0718 family)